MSEVRKFRNVNGANAEKTPQSVEMLLAQMTLAEKIGQMTQPEKNSVPPEDVAQYALGSVLSGGGGNPSLNNPQNWSEMTQAFIDAGHESRLGIPVIYGADCVHGHNNVYGATVFPHNIGLGATRDADLVERIGAATAREMIATNVFWNFSPCLAVPQDYRWGRTFEGFGGDTALVSELGAAYVRGLQGAGVAACIKHYVGDGGAEWDTHRSVSWATFWEDNGGAWKIDHGDVNVDEPTFRAVHLAPYLAALAEGALTVMASFSSWRGLKMHGHRYLLTDVLKNELGFGGFIVTDWMGINQLSPDWYTCVVQSINAGVDMVMVPFDYKSFIAAVTEAVTRGDIRMSRIDDAVRRILTVKQMLGLFETDLGTPEMVSSVGGADHRSLAREAVRKSAVLLKNELATLPITAETETILLAGAAADDMGMQCGGWTLNWQGEKGATVPGTTLRMALTARLADKMILYDATGTFSVQARLGIVVVGEQPYAEGCGDVDDLTLSAADLEVIQRVRAQCDKLALIIYSGRPLIINDALPLCDAIVAAWLPGSEGTGLADVLSGDHPFTGKLPHDWIASMDQLPQAARKDAGLVPLFAYGHGLTTGAL